jgi:hypothetical protein
MDDLDRWIYLDGPEPESLRTVLDALRDLPPPTPEDEARMARAYLARLAAKPADIRAEPPAGEEPHGDAPPPAPPAPAVRPLRVAPPDPEDAEPRGIATPAPSPEPPPVVTAPPPMTPVPAALASTSEVMQLPPLEERGKLPFVRPEDVPPNKRATRTRQSEVEPPSGLGSTAPLDDHSVARAKAALPFVPCLGGGELEIGGLTMNQYASFCAERAILPEAEAAVMERYHVRTPEARAALDEQWRKHLALVPSMRAVFQEKLNVFADYLRKRRAEVTRRQT